MFKTGAIYDFGHFRLDTTEEVLLCASKPVHLQLKAFSVLVVLVEKAGHVVEKDELLKLCWSDAFVEEANVAQSVCLIRRALGDSCRDPEYIETVHRRGYRFISHVRLNSGGREQGLTATDEDRITAGIERVAINAEINPEGTNCFVR